MNEEKYNRIVTYLDGINQYTAGTGVQRAKMLLSCLGNPEKSLKIIHVAGSNGKGSVCAYLASMFMAGEMRAGLFTSPHLVDIRERIQTNGEMISQEKFCELFMKVIAAQEQIRKTDRSFELAYFDYLFGISMLYFQEENVDFAIVETGLGGRLDATNAVEKPALAVITTISLEHTAILGNTVTQIAREKAGIIKPDVSVVFCDDQEDCTREIENYAERQSSKMVPVSSYNYEIMKNTGKDIAFSLHNEYYKNDCFFIVTAALYQVMNASIALTSMAVLENENAFALSLDQKRTGIKNMFWPGRMEEIAQDIYVDGAHNPQGIKAFVASVNSICESRKVESAMLLFSVVCDKDYEQMIQILEECRYFKTVLVTQTGGDRKLDKERIAAEFTGAKEITVLEFDKVSEAFEYGTTHKKNVLFCAGSLYLAGEIKEYIKTVKE